MHTSPFYKISPKLSSLAEEAEAACKAVFARAGETEFHNVQKVQRAFFDNRVSESHFAGTTGYGYGDRGRETLDRVMAQIMGAEEAIMSHSFVSGTHAIATALFGVLRPGDVMVSASGKPYDTLMGTLGIGPPGTSQHASSGSLEDFGVKYKQLELTESGEPDYLGIETAAKSARMVYVQRSRGYSLREPLSVETIGRIAKSAKRGNPNVVVMVDNCYGEFVEKKEPTDVGADLVAGSLIKNPGGGIAPTGGYIAGRRDLIGQCAQRLTAPGIGREVGCTLDTLRSLFMGLYLAPSTVASALKTVMFAARLFTKLGYQVFPAYDAPRTDIVQAIKLRTPKRLIRFCQAIQSASPVDAFVSPQPWDMPGYDSQVIMAAGTFVAGASIELSADAPLREPYAVWMQGGLSYQSGKLGVLLAADQVEG